MQWGVQHVRITLEEGESGELLVIEQTSDGRVVCERGLAAKGRRGTKGAEAGAEAAAKTSSVKPPVEAPMSMPTLPVGSIPKASRAPSSFRPPRPTYFGISLMRIGWSAETFIPGLG